MRRSGYGAFEYLGGKGTSAGPPPARLVTQKLAEIVPTIASSVKPSIDGPSTPM